MEGAGIAQYSGGRLDEEPQVQLQLSPSPLLTACVLQVLAQFLSDVQCNNTTVWKAPALPSGPLLLLFIAFGS